MTLKSKHLVHTTHLRRYFLDSDVSKPQMSNFAVRTGNPQLKNLEKSREKLKINLFAQQNEANFTKSRGLTPNKKR